MFTMLSTLFLWLREKLSDWGQNTPRSVPDGQLPYGLPKSTVVKAYPPRFICRTAYMTLNDLSARIPMWVLYILTPEHCDGDIKRSDAFAHDKSLPKGERAELSDYDDSGYDRGHMADDQDMRWDKKVERESFILSNICPQLPGFNRGIWKVLENTVRTWCTDRQNNLLVYMGPIYSQDSKKIGKNNVVVPDFFYKIVVDLVTKETVAFCFPHQDIADNDISKYQTSVKDIEDKTKIVFGVPDDKNVKQKLWPVNKEKLVHYLLKN